MCSCNSKQEESKQSTNTVVAQVGNKFLYESELMGVVPSGLGIEDSLRLLNSYLDEWVRKQLVIKEAVANQVLDEQELRRRLEDYKYALLAHEYQLKLVEEELNREVSQEELMDYYQTHKSDFELKENIIKAFYMKVPTNAPGLSKIKRMIRYSPIEKQEEIKAYCQKNSLSYHLAKDTWISFDQLVVKSTYFDTENPIQLLTSGNYFERSDGNFTYILRVLAYKLNDQVSPFSYAKDRIKNIVVYKRKLALIKKREKEIYEEAKKSGDFTVNYFTHP